MINDKINVNHLFFVWFKNDLELISTYGFAHKQKHNIVWNKVFERVDFWFVVELDKCKLS